MTTLMILKMLLTVLVVTLVLETLLAAIFFKTRSSRSILFVMLPQYITAVVSALFIGLFAPTITNIPYPQFIALGISLLFSILIEGLIFKINDLHDHPYVMALVLNIVSFAACSALSFFNILPSIF